MEGIGQRIRTLRKARALTQKQLGELLGISFQAVSKWEKGSCSPELSQIPALCRALGVTADELLGMVGEKDATRT